MLLMNMPALWSLAGSLVGLLLGGGLTILRDAIVRHADGRALDVALTSEVRALLEAIEARGFHRALADTRRAVVATLEAGASDRTGTFPQFPATWNYFATYDASLPKLGLLPARRAELFTRFYVAARSSCEVLMNRSGRPPPSLPLPALLAHLVTEERLADRAIALGHEIVGEAIVALPAISVER